MIIYHWEHGILYIIQFNINLIYRILYIRNVQSTLRDNLLQNITHI